MVADHASSGRFLAHPDEKNLRAVRGSDDVGRFGDAEKNPAHVTSDATLQSWAVADLKTVFGIDADPVDVLVHRWLDAMPQYGPGHGELAAELRSGLPPTLAIAGNFIDGIGVPACLSVANRAAAAVVAATTRR